MTSLSIKKGFRKKGKISSTEKNKEIEGSLLMYLRGHKGRITSLSFNPFFTHIVSGCNDGMVMLWKINPEQPEGTKPKVFRYEGHQGVVNDVCFSPDGSLIASASSDQSIRIWIPVVAGGRTQEWKAHTSAIRSIHFNPQNNEQLVSASDDKTLKIWSLNRIPKCLDKFKNPSHSFVSSFTNHNNWIKSVRYSPDGLQLCSASDDQTVRINDIRSKDSQIIFNTDGESPLFADFNPCDGAYHYVGVSTDKCNFHIIDTRHKTKFVQSYMNLHQKSINSFSFHPSGDYAACVSDDASTKILDLIEGRPLWTYYGHKEPLFAVKFSSNGEFLATAGEGKELLIWQPNLATYNTKDDDEERMLEDLLNRNRVFTSNNRNDSSTTNSITLSSNSAT